MNASLGMLLDTLFRQSMTLVARLAVSNGSRVPLAHMPSQTFVYLTQELRAQGLGHKVIADMLGMTLRAYHGKVQRLHREQARRDRSLWQALVDYFHAEQGLVTKPQLLRKFRYEDSASVLGIINDLVSSGFLRREGEGERVTYHKAQEIAASMDEQALHALCSIVWILVRRYGPFGLQELKDHLPTRDEEELAAALAKLESEGRVTRHGLDAEEIFATPACVIPTDDTASWMGAMIDHLNAVVNTLSIKAERTKQREFDSHCGGSTFTFELDDDHPLKEQVLQHFEEVRQASSTLRQKVDAYNKEHSLAERVFRVTFYAGQHVLSDVVPQERIK